MNVRRGKSLTLLGGRILPLPRPEIIFAVYSNGFSPKLDWKMALVSSSRQVVQDLYGGVTMNDTEHAYIMRKF
jgi:hypothetical protein